MEFDVHHPKPFKGGQFRNLINISTCALLQAGPKGGRGQYDRGYMPCSIILSESNPVL